jgi:pimeloyl-ACP methyl ester carboxylesterase
MSVVGAAQSISDAGAPAPDGAIQRLVVDGIEIVRREGRTADAPIVLLHGIGSNAGSFEPLMACLDQNRTVVAWNCPGYGRSTPLAGE